MTKVYRVENLDCANCAAKIERALGKIDGVRSASVSFLMQKITLDIDEGADVDLLVAKTCKKIEPDMRIK